MFTSYMGKKNIKGEGRIIKGHFREFYITLIHEYKINKGKKKDGLYCIFIILFLLKS